MKSRSVARFAEGWQFFRRPAIWRLCLGRWVSDWGDAVHILAFNWLLVTQAGSAAAVGACQALWLVGQLAGSWPGGRLVDRMDARKLLAVSYGLHALVIAGFALVAFVGLGKGGPTLFAVFALFSLGLGVLGAPTDPAQRTLLKQVSGTDTALLARLNGLLGSGGAIAQCVGPLVAGWLLMVAPTATAFALNALTFVVAAIAHHGIPARPLPTGTSDPLPLGPASSEGSLLGQVRPLLPALVASSGFVFGPAALLVLFLPYYVQQVQHWPAAALGTLESARWLGLGLGTLLGSFVIARLTRKLWPVLALVLAAMTGPLVGFAAGGGPDWIAQAAWLAAIGALAGFAHVCLNQLFLQEVREEWIGRVNGALAAYVGCGLLGAGLLWWAIIEYQGYPAAFRYAGLGFALSLLPISIAAVRPVNRYFSLDNRPKEF